MRLENLFYLSFIVAFVFFTDGAPIQTAEEGYDLALTDASFYITDEACQTNCNSSGCSTYFYSDRCHLQDISDSRDGYMACATSVASLNGLNRECSKGHRFQGVCKYYCKEIYDRIIEVYITKPTTSTNTPPSTTVRYTLTNGGISGISIVLVFVVAGTVLVVCLRCGKKKATDNQQKEEKCCPDSGEPMELQKVKCKEERNKDNKGESDEVSALLEEQDENYVKPDSESTPKLDPPEPVPTTPTNRANRRSGGVQEEQGKHTSKNRDQHETKSFNGNGYLHPKSSTTSNSPNLINPDEDTVLRQVNRPIGLSNVNGKRCSINALMQALAPLNDVINGWLWEGENSSADILPLKVKRWANKLNDLGKGSSIHESSKDVEINIFYKLGWLEIHGVERQEDDDIEELQEDAHDLFMDLLNKVGKPIRAIANGPSTSRLGHVHLEPLDSIFTNLLVSLLPTDEHDDVPNKGGEKCIPTLEDLIQYQMNQDLTVDFSRPCLSIRLDRACSESGVTTKRQDKIRYPLELYLPPNQTENRSAYKLESIICHIGTDYNSGHYTTYRRFLHGWFLANDSSVEEKSEREILAEEENVYMLFYRKIM